MKNSTYPFVDFKMVQVYRRLERALQWRVDSIFRDLAPFVFTVEVSEDPAFGSLTYSISAGANFYALDDTQTLQSTVVDLYYRVKLETGSQHTYYSAPLIFYARGERRAAYLKAKEIIRKEFVRFRFTGYKGWLLKRKNYGEQNPGNIDPITGVPLTDNNVDLGTGIKGGYYPALPITYSLEARDSTSQLNQEGFGTTAASIQKHRFAGFPVVEPYDVLISDNNARYRYTKVNSIFMPSTELLLTQTADASLLPPTDSIYYIEVPNV